MMDFDPRDRDDERPVSHPSHGERSRGGGDTRPALGRGPSSADRETERPSRDQVIYLRDRDHDGRGHHRDGPSRDVFERDVDLPRGPEREVVHDGRREYTLRGSEARTLATVGAFRVVSSRDLVDASGRSASPRVGDLRHLREQGLIETVRIPGTRDHAVGLTAAGARLLEANRAPGLDRPQAFHAGIKRPRELEHDVHVYRAYEHAARAIEERGGRVGRVVLDHELKREYQRWRNDRDRDHEDEHQGERTAAEVRAWAHEHDLPYFDAQVHFPDARIEYYEPEDERWRCLDLEVETPHFRGAHAASVARSGFSRYRVGSLSVGGRGGSGGRGGTRRRGLAEDFLCGRPCSSATGSARCARWATRRANCASCGWCSGAVACACRDSTPATPASPRAGAGAWGSSAGWCVAGMPLACRAGTTGRMFPTSTDEPSRPPSARTQRATGGRCPQGWSWSG